MNIYLDIDGVLVSDCLDENYRKPTRGSLELIKNFTGKHQCFWLTTHCKGDDSNVKEYLLEIFGQEILKYFKLIKPTFWSVNKTEGIDFTKDFLWIDDEIYTDELAILKINNALHKHILINLKDNPDQLLEVIKNSN